MKERISQMPESNPRETVSMETIKRWNDRNYPVEYYGQSYSAIILGENHHDDDAQKKQVELIRLIRPGFIISESLKGWIYNPTIGKIKKQKNRRFDDVDLVSPRDDMPDKIIIDVAKEMDITIIGCDITDAELSMAWQKVAKQYPEKYTYDYEHGLLENKKDGSSADIFHGSEEIMPFRDRQMAETVLHYLGETTKPIVQILGAAHGKNIHALKLLQGKKFGYVLVDQTRKL